MPDIVIPIEKLFDAAHRWIFINHPELLGKKCRFRTVPEGLAIDVIEGEASETNPDQGGAGNR